METSAIIAIFLTTVGGLVTAVVMYLLAQKDARQAEQIKDLYDKHNNDAERLQKLELDVAKNNYSKDEINSMFTDMKKYLDGRFERLERFFDEARKPQL